MNHSTGFVYFFVIFLLFPILWQSLLDSLVPKIYVLCHFNKGSAELCFPQG